MQTCRQSRFEVGADFGVSLCVNIIGQLCFYGSLATVGRSLTFVALVLGLAIPRRYTTRRLFNTLVAPGTRQPHWQSWLEVSVDTAVAIVVAILLQRWCYGSAATWVKASSLTVLLYAFTLVRRYAMRRLFETRGLRQEPVVLYPSSGVSR